MQITAATRRPRSLAGWCWQTLTFWIPGGLVVAVLTACGGGGGGDGGNSPGSVDGSRFTAAFVPLATGDRRLWAAVSDGVPQAHTLEVVGDTTTAAGYTVHRVRDEAGEISLVARTATGVLAVPGGSVDELLDLFGPLELIRFGLAAGESVQLIDRSASADLDGDRRADNVHLRVQFTVQGFGAVQVPAGRFEGAAQVRTTVAVDFSYADGRGLSLQIESDEWYAPGVGLVRSLVRTRGTGSSDSVESSELLAYAVGDRRSDTVAPRIVQAATSDGVRTGPQPLLSLRFSEALDTWGLAGRDGATLGLHLVDAQGHLQPGQVLVDADGLGARWQPLGPLAEGAYSLRLGSAAVDWAGNAVQGGEIRFTVDTTGPRLVSSTPAADALAAAVLGALSLRFDEAVRPAPGTELFIELGWLFSGEPPQRLRATASGNTVSATLDTPLRHNATYELRLDGTLLDEVGNTLPAASVVFTFRTDPGPLARPEPLAEGLRVWSVRQGDIDGDGQQDLVFVASTRQVTPPSPRAVLGVRPGLASGGFGPARTLATIDENTVCAGSESVLGDFDGNGRLDVAIACGPYLQVMMQAPDGSCRTERPGVNGSQGLGAQDLDGDGRADLLLLGTGPDQDVGTQQNWQAVRRETDGRWSALPMPEMGGDFAFAFGAALADLDGDGRKDLVWARRTMSDQRLELAWALRQTTGFGPVNSRLVTTGNDFSFALAVADADGDGRADALLVTQGTASATLWLMPGQAGGFGSAQAVALVGGASFVGLAVADLDGDARADILLQPDSQARVAVLLQTSPGAWEAPRLFELSETGFDSGLSMQVLDVNGDGLRDLLVRGDVLLGRAWAGAWPAAAPIGPRALAPAPPRTSGHLRSAGRTLVRAAAFAAGLQGPDPAARGHPWRP